MNLISIILIAMLVEAVIQAIKPLWDKTAKPLTVPELISMGIGVVIALVGKINLIGALVITENIILLYIFYILTGIAIGRGPSFIHDVWAKFKLVSPNIGDGNDAEQ
jgi:hypothetical protein